MLDDNGYEGFRVEEVARRVGVAKGTVYLDFDSKQQLIDAALATAGESLVAELSAAVQDIPDPHDRLFEAGRRTAVSMVERPWLGVLVEARPVFGGSEGSPQPCTPLRAYLERLLREARKASALMGRVKKEAAAEAILGLLSRPTWRALVAKVGFAEALRTSGLEPSLSVAPS